jgi:hypothetical protein
MSSSVAVGGIIIPFCFWVVFFGEKNSVKKGGIRFSMGRGVFFTFYVG